MTDRPGPDFVYAGIATWERVVPIHDDAGEVNGECTITVDVDGDMWLSLSVEHPPLSNVVQVLDVIAGAEIASAVWTASTYAAPLEKGAAPDAGSGAPS